MCPSTVTLISCLSRRASSSPICPARRPPRGTARRSGSAAFAISAGSFTPSATTTVVYFRPSLSRARTKSQILSMANGISGIRITWAPEARPAGIAPPGDAGGGVDFVDGIGGGVQGRIEAERKIGGRKIVIDRLGDTHQIQALAIKLERDLERAIPADDHQRIESRGLRIADHVVGKIQDIFLAFLNHLVMKRIAPVGGAQNGAAARKQPAGVSQRQLALLVGPDQPVKTVLDADHLPAVPDDRRSDNAANNGIQSGTVAASGANSDLSYRHIAILANAGRTKNTFTAKDA